ncbi:uncharacterized protein LOC117828964 [Notolabrus celidotus]|uniref:uncharacterized protein LOC117828964 n=1 Tax=Notolabrus celidotus TaxID=1203425 RepID=UPI00148F4842|nr:uncharacterized protein LOC117828964 [Notolabrus celidotus]
MTSETVRRSSRLLAAGYYKEDGTPHLSYNERLFKVFKKRRSYSYDDDSMSSYSSQEFNYFGGYCQNFIQYTRDDSEDIPLLVQNNETQTTWTGSLHKRDTETQTTQTWTQHSETQTPRCTTGNMQTQTIPAARTTWSSLWLKISCFLLMLLLNFGLTHVYLKFGVQQESSRNQPWDDMVFPRANTFPNFALESLGASVLGHLSSDTYHPQDNTGYIWDDRIHRLYAYQKQRTVIQGHPWLNPGECWPFAGEQGHLFISLSHPVSITHVTLGHITKSKSPNGHIASAPREFSVYGFTTTDEEGVFLGRQVYNPDGAEQQTFAMPNHDKGVFRYVKVMIENNWGNSDHTCLYSFKVHGAAVCSALGAGGLLATPKLPSVIDRPLQVS